MLKLDAARLTALGYSGLTGDQMNELLDELYNAGEEIVGIKLAADMTNEQLDSFERLVDANDDAGALAWLKVNFPGYVQIVEKTFEELDDVLREALATVRPDAIEKPTYNPLSDSKEAEDAH